MKRITTSVVIDGNISEATRASINNSVTAAVGFSKDRGDVISVEGMKFDSSVADKYNKDIQDLNKEAEVAAKMALYTKAGVAAGAALLALILFLIFRKKKDRNADGYAEVEEEVMEGANLDVLLDDEVTPSALKFKPIQFEVENERTHVEKEIKKYATDKPDQVIDIIKSWLAEDER